MVENTNKKYSRAKWWNYFYSYLVMRYTINANKLKAIARMNEHEDMRIECDIFLSLAFSYWLVGDCQLDIVENTNKNIRVTCYETTFILTVCTRNTINANKLKAIAPMKKHEDVDIECEFFFYLLHSLTDYWEITS